ncbi:MAG: hypothetical protein ACYT04_51785 [Nostoc sp.]
MLFDTSEQQILKILCANRVNNRAIAIPFCNTTLYRSVFMGAIAAFTFG